MNTKHWSPRMARARAEIERLHEIYLPSAFKERCREGTVGDTRHFELEDHRILDAKLVVVLGSLFPTSIWLLEDGRMAMNLWGMREIKADWARLGSGRPWGDGFKIAMYP